MAVTLSGPLDAGFRWRIVVDDGDPTTLETELTGILADIGSRGGGAVQLWVRTVDEELDRVATDLGFDAYRDLWQMRCPLPVEGTDLVVRPFADDDAGAFLAVNNRAFSWHPEQGDMSEADLSERRAEPWFDPQGFLLHDRDGRLAGFCWTKEHRDTTPPLGEIYVIAVDPDFAGRGLGTALTRAGLAHLAAAGLTTGMLYVESDNHAAVATYHRIGFTRHHTDRAYRTHVEAT
ncbi:MAG: mycothiol synthase [Acidimicrobiales bacterium]